MGLENLEVVDAVGIDTVTGSVILTIVDSWDWEDSHRHLLALQKKLNVYFEFIESGQIWESYPDADGRNLVIDVVFRFPVLEPGLQFLDYASATASDLGVKVSFRHHSGPN